MTYARGATASDMEAAARVKYTPANDNTPQDESGQSAGFGIIPQPAFEGGQYIGLTRKTNFTVKPPPRIGDFIQTYTARQYYPMDPRAEEVCLEDIAHSLSLQCRYAGHCILFYSVAEHSVHIARWLRQHYGPLTALYGLLHDAPETYLVDVPRPVKPYLSNYKSIEASNWAAVAAKFGLPGLMPGAVHEADTRIIGDELVNMRPMDWHARYDDPLGVGIECWSPAVAEAEFLAMFATLDKLTKKERVV